MPDIDGAGESIAAIAERSSTPEDTVLRVMQGRWKTISLDLADRLLVACGNHISECDLVWPAGHANNRAKKPKMGLTPSLR